MHSLYGQECINAPVKPWCIYGNDMLMNNIDLKFTKYKMFRNNILFQYYSLKLNLIVFIFVIKEKILVS